MSIDGLDSDIFEANRSQTILGDALKRATMRVYFDMAKTKGKGFESAIAAVNNQIRKRKQSLAIAVRQEEIKAAMNLSNTGTADGVVSTVKELGVGQSLRKLFQSSSSVSKVLRVRKGLYIAQVKVSYFILFSAFICKVSSIRSKWRFEAMVDNDEDLSELSKGLLSTRYGILI